MSIVRRILTPGWAGEMSTVEVITLLRLIHASPGLRVRWGLVNPAWKPSLNYIRAVALHGVGSDEATVELKKIDERTTKTKGKK